ncbi:MAG: phospholipase D-like domain-containing protein [Desulfitobacteriaceae bacterium]
MFRRFLPLILTFVVLFAGGCSIPTPRFLQKETPVSNLPAESLLLTGNEIYDRTIAMLNSAQTAIYVEQGLFDDPRLLDLIIKKADSGVEVKVLLDQFRKANASALKELKSHDISAQYYPARKGQSNNVKLLVVDHKQALVYGPTWTQEGMSARDLAIELSGQAAWKAAGVFARDWEFTTTLSLKIPKTSTAPDDNIILATNANVKQQLQALISRSTGSIWLEVTEVTDPDIIQSLIDIKQKGREIRLLINKEFADKEDVAPIVAKLKEVGISIRYLKESSNVRLGIFDDSSFFFSSSGWTYSAFVINHEFSLSVPSPQATAKLRELFDQDWSNATEA